MITWLCVICEILINLEFINNCEVTSEALNQYVTVTEDLNLLDNVEWFAAKIENHEKTVGTMATKCRDSFRTRQTSNVETFANGL